MTLLLKLKAKKTLICKQTLLIYNSVRYASDDESEVLVNNNRVSKKKSVAFSDSTNSQKNDKEVASNNAGNQNEGFSNEEIVEDPISPKEAVAQAFGVEEPFIKPKRGIREILGFIKPADAKPCDEKNSNLNEGLHEGNRNKTIEKLTETLWGNPVSEEVKNRYLVLEKAEREKLNNATNDNFRRAALEPDKVIQEYGEIQPLTQTLKTTLEVIAATSQVVAEKLNVNLEKSKELTTRWAVLVTKFDDLIERIKNYNTFSYKAIALTFFGLTVGGCVLQMFITGKIPDLASDVVTAVFKSISQAGKGAAKESAKNADSAGVLEFTKEVAKDHPLVIPVLVIGGLSVTAAVFMGLRSQRLALNLVKNVIPKLFKK